ncbi:MULTISPECIES: hypothetical protein [Cytobacillus]|uniref:hypothetical protein n=1 Tax=Cytobacillus TaxID=2675230 RepID=UPI00203EC636|nr:hypothetical protein [Cytobacillus firmus]MCM3706499.1 hypothetical protein [Cytobacillus firmus]
MKRYSISALLLLGALLFGLVVYVSVFNEFGSNGNTFLNAYDDYMKHTEYESLEFHPDEDHIYFLYENTSENTIGLVEYSKNGEVKTEMGKQKGLDFYVLFLEGEYNNYTGVKFERDPQEVGYFELNSQEGKTEKFVVNSNKENSYTESYIAKTKLDPDSIQRIKVFTKDGEQIYQESIK